MRIRVFFDMSDYIDFDEVMSYHFLENHLSIARSGNRLELIPIGEYYRISIADA